MRAAGSRARPGPRPRPAAGRRRARPARPGMPRRGARRPGAAPACPRDRRLSPQWPEAGADFADERLGLLERGEVAALIQFVPVLHVRELLVGPAAGRAEDLLGEDRAADRNRDRAEEPL